MDLSREKTLITKLLASHAGCRGLESHHPLKREGDEMAKYLTAKQVMRRYGISRSTLWRAMRGGAPRKAKTYWIYVPPKRFHRWVEDNRPEWLIREWREDRKARSQARQKAWISRKAASAC